MQLQVILTLCVCAAAAVTSAASSSDVCALSKERLYVHDSAQRAHFPTGFRACEDSNKCGDCACRQPHTQRKDGKSVSFAACFDSAACAGSTEHVRCSNLTKEYEPGKVEAAHGDTGGFTPDNVNTNLAAVDERETVDDSKMPWILGGGIVAAVGAIMLFAVVRNGRSAPEQPEYKDSETTKARTKVVKGTQMQQQQRPSTIARLDSGFTSFVNDPAGSSIPPLRRSNGPTTPPKRRKPSTPPRRSQAAPSTPPKRQLPPEFPERLTPPDVCVEGFSDVSLDSDTFRREAAALEVEGSALAVHTDDSSDSSPSASRDLEF